MAKIKVSDWVARFIASQGVKHVFTVAGGGNTHLIDSFAANPDLFYVCCHHEQACAMAAEGYARANENLGVCCVTFGPAATNTLTGVAGAWLDSIPVLFISGQAQRRHMAKPPLRQLGVQEVDIISMVRSITKMAVVLDDPVKVQQVFQEAVWLARTGRPGPVYIDIPGDVQSAMVEEDQLAYCLPVTFEPDLEAPVAEVLSLICNAKRPLFFFGHGIRLAKARKEAQAVLDHFGIPVVTSMSAHDLIPSDHWFYAGRPGVFGDRAGNLAVQNADLIISVGARHHLWNIGYDTADFGRNATKVVVDIDPAELGKTTYVPDLPICADAGDFLRKLLHQARNLSTPSALPPSSTWPSQCRAWRTAFPVNLPEYSAWSPDYVNSYHFTDVLSHHLADDEVVVTGVGTSFTGTLQSIRLRAQQRLHCNVGCASMGWDLPAAIGASLAAGGKQVVLLTGDGSIMMNLQELQTIVYHQLPIKVFLFNNSGYLAIKNTQNAQFGGRLNAVDEQTGVSFPSFRRIAEAFGIEYRRIDDHRHMETIIKHTLADRGPIITELLMDPDQPLIPRVGAQMVDGKLVARPLDDMFPHLTPEQYRATMVDTAAS